MKNIPITAKAGLELIEEFIKAKKITPQNSKGLRVWGEKKEALRNGTVLQEKYLSNRFTDWTNLTDKTERLTVQKQIIDSVCFEIGYSDINDFLLKKGYLNESLSLLPSKNLNELRQLNPSEASEWIDKYVIGAQIVPSIIAISPIPVILSVITYQIDDVPKFLIWVIITLFICLAFVIAGSNSLKGKAFETKFFKSEEQLSFPSGYLMSYNQETLYSQHQKLEYRQKIAMYFDLTLMSEQEEKKHPKEAIQLLSQAGTKVKDNIKSVKIRSRNIRYGLIRNLIPATRLGAILSSTLIALGIILSLLGSYLVLSSSLILSITFWYIYKRLCSGELLRQAGEAFAQYLLDEFLSR